MRVTKETGVTVITEDFLPSEPEAPKGKKFQKRLTDEAKKQGVATEGMSLAEQETALQQASLIAAGDSPLKPMAVRQGKMLATYVAPRYGQKENGDRFVDLEFSFPLTDEHEGHVPRSVWHWRGQILDGAGSPKIVGIEVRDQTIDVYLAPDDKDVELHLSACPVRNASLAIIEQTGKGAATKEVRFSFRVRAELSKNVCLFADWSFGNAVWITMDDAQAQLGV